MTATIQEIFGPKQYAGDVGIEIEVEGRNIPKDNFGVWKVTEDNSLRGEAREYVTRRPLALEDVQKNVLALETAFKDMGSEFYPSHRGSIHIHTNVQKLTLDQIFGILFTWSMIEGVWLRLCGGTREANLFCVPTCSTGDLKEFTRAMLNCIRWENFHRFPADRKYASLNTNPIAKYGSIEFRTFESSINPETVEKYSRWCVNLREYGAKIDRNNLTAEWKKVLDDPVTFARGIFGGGFVWEDDFKDMIEQGCETAADLTLAWAYHESELSALKQPQKAKPEKIQGNVFEDHPAAFANLAEVVVAPRRHRFVMRPDGQWVFEE